MQLVVSTEFGVGTHLQLAASPLSAAAGHLVAVPPGGKPAGAPVPAAAAAPEPPSAVAAPLAARAACALPHLAPEEAGCGGATAVAHVEAPVQLAALLPSPTPVA